MSDKTYNKPPWIKTGRRTRAMRSAKKQKNMEMREKRRAEGYVEMDHDSAEIYWAGNYSGSINVKGSDGNNYYANFDLVLDKNAEEGNTPVQEPMEFGEMANWRPMDGTPGLKRQRAETFNAYSDPISDRQVYKIKELGGKVDSTMNRSQASDYIKDLMGVPSGTWKAEGGETCQDDHLDGIDFLPWSPDAEGPDCYITGLPNPDGDVEGEDNICEPCQSKWIYDEGGPEGEGYYRVSAMEAEYISDLSNGIVQFEDGSGFSSASAPPNDIHFGAENQVFALTYWIDEGVNIDDINDVSEALELYLSLSDDIAEMEDLELQKHPRYELAKRLQSDLSYRLDELQTTLPDITTDIEMDAEYDAWRSAFADGASATMLHKYDRNWMSKVNNPRSTYIRSYWNDAEPEFMEELRSAEGDYLDRMSFRASYAKPLAVVAGLAAALLAYRKL